jgi:hypothetical protein
MTTRSNRFAGPILLSLCSLALITPAAAVAQDKGKPAKPKAGAAKTSSAMKLSSDWNRDRREVRRDGRPKDGPRDPGRPRPPGTIVDNPTSP